MATEDSLWKMTHLYPVSTSWTGSAFFYNWHDHYLLDGYDAIKDQKALSNFRMEQSTR